MKKNSYFVWNTEANVIGLYEPFGDLGKITLLEDEVVEGSDNNILCPAYPIRLLTQFYKWVILEEIK